MHNLLRRQLKHYLGDLSQVPEQWRDFIEAVNDAYHEFDADRAMLERSLDLSSHELLQVNSEMRAIFQSIPDLLFRLDCEGAILNCTTGGLFDYFGNLRELTGKRIHDVFSMDAADQFPALIKSVRETNSVVITGCCLPFNNRNRYFEARLMALSRDRVIALMRDITDNKETENKLKESEQWLDSIIQASPIPAFAIGRDHRVVHWNKALEELSGIRAAEVIGTKDHWKAFYRYERPCLSDLLVDEDHETIENLYAEQQRKSKLSSDAYEAICFFPELNDEGKWLQITAAAIRNSQSGLVGAIETIEDITDRNRTLEKLKRSEERFSKIFKANPVQISLSSLKYECYIDVNESFLTHTGYTREEVIGRSSVELGLWSANARDHFVEVLKRDGKVRDFEFQFRVKSGDLLIGCLSAELIEFEGEPYALVIANDITERKRAEDELKESQQRLADIIDFLPDATFVIDRDGKVIAWNRAMEEMTEIRAADILGKGDYEYALPFYGERRPIFIDLLDAGDEELESKYKNVMKRDGILCAETYTPNIYRRKGAYLFGTTAPLFDAHGNRAGAIESIRDITEQKRAEEALKRNEEKYRELVESANSIILRMDTMGKVIFVNEFAQRFFGYGAEELVGKNVVGTIVPEVETTTGRDLQLMIEDIGRNPGRYESNINENMRRCGERVWVAWTNKPIYDENGRIVEVLCVGNDITERKQAEEALKRANILLFTQKETSIEGILAVDENHAIISSNGRFIDMWGISPELVERREDAPVLLALMEKVNEPQAFLKRVEYLYAHRDETSLEEVLLRDGRTFERYSAPMKGADGRYYGRVWYFRDITERKFMEKIVAEAEAKYRDIFENSVTGIFQISPGGRFLSVNASIANMLGYDSTQELIDSVIEVPQLYVHPERRSEMLGLIEEHGWVREFEAELLRKDKSAVWVSLNIRAVRNSTGEIAYMEGTAIDITDRKLLQSQLEQAQKMEAIGTLAGGIAHDFNNILTPIIGYAELSISSVPEDSRLRLNMDQILFCGNRAKELVRQILTFSRKTKQERKLVQVSLVIEEALKLVRSLLPSTIDIRHLIQEDAVESTAMVDPTQIQQVLINLCSNAEHAMRAKGGTLSVVLANVDIGPGAARGSTDLEPGAYLKLSVSDTGHGMDEAVKQRIFDPYFTTKGPNEGTGLGLAVVYGIVRGLSGAITVSSKPGRGTTFDVYFPRVKVAQVPASELSEPLPTGHGRVLVVDDEKSIGDMIGEMLATLGYDAVSMHSSTDALEAFRARPESFDLIITDLTMPHMTGIDLAREILTMRPHIPIILFTGFSDTADVSRIKLPGIKELLMKPVSMHDLAVAVNKLLYRDPLPSGMPS
jgi:PAS domain S-box-containing protein